VTETIAATFVLEVVDHQPAIRCLLCGSISFNPTDLEQSYCARCHLFHESVRDGRRMLAVGAGHECDEWRTALGRCALCDRPLPRRIGEVDDDGP
jgi:Zn finger protein HypA/HybF involved in hydrogenase expression